MPNSLKRLCPAQFAATSEYVFYRPRASEPYAAPADAWVPVQAALLQGSDLRGHSFVGLRFRHATWRAPSEPGGYVPSQTLVTAAQVPQPSRVRCSTTMFSIFIWSFSFCFPGLNLYLLSPRLTTKPAG